MNSKHFFAMLTPTKRSRVSTAKNAIAEIAKSDDAAQGGEALGECRRVGDWYFVGGVWVPAPKIGGLIERKPKMEPKEFANKFEAMVAPSMVHASRALGAAMMNAAVMEAVIGALIKGNTLLPAVFLGELKSSVASVRFDQESTPDVYSQAAQTGADAVSGQLVALIQTIVDRRDAEALRAADREIEKANRKRPRPPGWSLKI